MLDKILIPLDGSSLSEIAIDYVKELATAFDSEVHLISVVEKKDAEYDRMSEVYLHEITEHAQRYFDEANPKVAVKSTLVHGNPTTEVVNYSQKKHIDLVILVSHGHSGIMPWTMGSTANKLVHNLETSVLLVSASMFKSKRRPVKVFSKILLSLDGSEAGGTALPLVREIAKRLNSAVTLFSVLEIVQHVRTIGGQDHIQYFDDQIKVMKAEIEDYLSSVHQKFAKDGINVRTVLEEGDPAKEIIKYAKDQKTRLVAMSSHGRSGIHDWVFGSVSNKVLHAGKTPLLIVRSTNKDKK